MGKIMVIVESPGKIKKLQKILGDKYVVTSSVGHIIDLPLKDVDKNGNPSVDVNDNFKPSYEPIARQVKVISELKKMYKTADDVLIAADEDREGEMIAWSIAHVLKIKKPKRMVFNSITKTEILEAVKKVGGINMPMVNAQKARRILDRIVGYDTSKLLWSYMPSAKSAGRVQSVIVKLIVEKEREIDEFITGKMKNSFKIDATFYQTEEDKKNKQFLKAALHEVKKITKESATGPIAKISEEAEARSLMEKCSKSKFKIHDISNKENVRKPPAPFTTSTMQQEASRKLGMSIKRTMAAAKKLYEAGKITYLRTDSIHLSEDALSAIGKYVKKTYGEKYYKRTEYQNKKGNTQEAHEAIRPTNIDLMSFESDNNDEVRLYNLIWKRAVASQMKPAIFDVMVIVILSDKFSSYFFQSSIQTLKFAGFLKVYNMKSAFDKDENEESNDSDAFSGKKPTVGTRVYGNVIRAKQAYDQPPYRFSEASLVAKLDPKDLGICRPATFEAFIQKIQDREYVKKGDIEGIQKDILELCWDGGDIVKEKVIKTKVGSENNKFIPTSLGIAVTDYLQENLPFIMDYAFTAKMEENLDKIAEGKLIWHQVLREFYDKFEPIVTKLRTEAKTKVDESHRELGVDPKTGGTVYVRDGKYGGMVMLIKDGKTINKGPAKPHKVSKITLEQALVILEYPIIVGKIGGKELKLYKDKFNEGKYYVKVGNSKKADKVNVDSKDVTVEEIKKLLEKKNENLLHKVDGKEYRLMESKFEGNKYYIAITEKGKKMKSVSVPDDVDAKKLTVEQIEEMLTNKFKNKFKKFDKKGKTDKSEKQTGGKKVTKKTTKKTTDQAKPYKKNFKKISKN